MDYRMLEKLMKFILTQGRRNLTLAGYFAKVVNSFINRRGSNILDYVYERPEIIDALITHIYSRSLAEVLSKIINFDSTLIFGTEKWLVSEF